ncbi:hypothetical protein [Bacillus coahuilensis]|uniref:hypothetical protein n=1 Tax=Bacillus coahuilensis TaxID=408580 RepID=UPI0007513AF4|nr:hypothetical protein [Bacillus coahuilensis]
MFKLVRNENMKLYSKISTWVMLSILLIGVLMAIVVTKVVSNPTDWKQDLQKQIAMQQVDLESARNTLPAEALIDMEREIQLNQYRLDHNSMPMTATVWGISLQMSLYFIPTCNIVYGYCSREYCGGGIFNRNCKNASH